MKKYKNIKAFTFAEENCQVANSICKFGKVEDAQYNYKAFTLAEVLITLAIIGVVSALVIPSVLKNYNDKKYNTARLKALKTFGEAGKMASINGEINGQPSARAFVENVLSKYLKITKVCEKAEQCNFPTNIQPLNKEEEGKQSDEITNWKNLNRYNHTNINTDISDKKFNTYIQTTDGFSAKLFYNPKCIRNSHDTPTYDIYSQHFVCSTEECNSSTLDITCMNVIYDMNGIKTPNHVGEDIGFVTVFWSGLKATSAAPGILPYEVNSSAPGKKYTEALVYCASLGKNKKSYMLPNADEASSLILNKELLSMPNYGWIWSGTSVYNSINEMWAVGYSNNRWKSGINQGSTAAYCVRR